MKKIVRLINHEDQAVTFVEALEAVVKIVGNIDTEQKVHCGSRTNADRQLVFFFVDGSGHKEEFDMTDCTIRIVGKDGSLKWKWGNERLLEGSPND